MAFFTMSSAHATDGEKSNMAAFLVRSLLLRLAWLGFIEPQKVWDVQPLIKWTYERFTGRKNDR